MEKTCGKCGASKPITDFNKKGKTVQSICRECSKANSKQHYYANKEYYADKNAKRRKELFDWYKAFKSTLKCEKCGESHPGCLDFHHKDPSTKEFPISQLHMVSKQALLDEIAKCEVLCSNCHRKLHYESDV